MDEIITIDDDGALWRTSSYSQGNGNCVEVAFAPDAVRVRDSKDRSGPELIFTFAEWDAFDAGMRDGEFKVSAS